MLAPPPPPPTSQGQVQNTPPWMQQQQQQGKTTPSMSSLLSPPPPPPPPSSGSGPAQQQQQNLMNIQAHILQMGKTEGNSGRGMMMNNSNSQNPGQAPSRMPQNMFMQANACFNNQGNSGNAQDQFGIGQRDGNQSGRMHGMGDLRMNGGMSSSGMNESIMGGGRNNFMLSNQGNGPRGQLNDNTQGVMNRQGDMMGQQRQNSQWR